MHYIILITDTGIPVCQLNSSNNCAHNSLTFACLGLLSSLNSQANNNANLLIKQLQSHDNLIQYYDNSNGYLLILSTNNIHFKHTIASILDNYYHLFQFFLGNNILSDNSNIAIEKIKRKIKINTNITNCIIKALQNDYTLASVNSINHKSIQNSLLQSLNDNLSQVSKLCNNTLHVALYYNSIFIAATNPFNSLSFADRLNFQQYIAGNEMKSSEITIFLQSNLQSNSVQANTAYKTAYRLLSITLSDEFKLLLLCGPTPTLEQVNQIISENTNFVEQVTQTAKQILQQHQQFLCSYSTLARCIFVENQQKFAEYCNEHEKEEQSKLMLYTYYHQTIKTNKMNTCSYLNTNDNKGIFALIKEHCSVYCVFNERIQYSKHNSIMKQLLDQLTTPTKI
jgi:hypothetical protein